MKEVKWSEAIKIGILGGISTKLVLQFGGDFKLYLLIGISIIIFIYYAMEES